MHLNFVVILCFRKMKAWAMGLCSIQWVKSQINLIIYRHTYRIKEIDMPSSKQQSQSPVSSTCPMYFFLTSAVHSKVPSSASLVPAVSHHIAACSTSSFVRFPHSLSSLLLLPQNSLLFSLILHPLWHYHCTDVQCCRPLQHPLEFTSDVQG